MILTSNSMISIIIVNYNGKYDLIECLESLKKLSYENFEIILVDNNSVDGSTEFVAANFSNVKIIKLEKNYGFAAANNIGAKTAVGELFLFLNNDTIVTPYFLNELIKPLLSDEKIAICQPLLFRIDGSIDSSGDYVDVYGRSYSTTNIEDKIKHILSARGAALLIRKDIFWELDGFDSEFFFAFEDIDLGWRAWIYGYKCILVPASNVIHKSGRSLKQLNSELEFHSIKNNFILRYTDFDGKYMLTSILMFFLMNFIKKVFKISIVKEVVSLDYNPSFSTILRSLRWIFQNRNYIQEKKKRVSSKRKLSTNKLIEMNLITKIS